MAVISVEVYRIVEETCVVLRRRLQVVLMRWRHCNYYYQRFVLVLDRDLEHWKTDDLHRRANVQNCDTLSSLEGDSRHKRPLFDTSCVGIGEGQISEEYTRWKSMS